MDKTHLQPFLDAMHAKDAGRLTGHMSDDVTLRSPILLDPVKGKDEVGGLLAALLGIVDDFTVTGVIETDTHAAVFVTIRAGDVQVEGIDDMHVDGSGLVCATTIHWRPLAQIVAMQQKLAASVGFPAMQLVPV